MNVIDLQSNARPRGGRIEHYWFGNASTGLCRTQFHRNLVPFDPYRVSERLRVRSRSTVQRGDERRDCVGNVVGREDQAWWCLSTEGAVESKDINEHFRYLQARFPITREVLEPMAPNARTYIDVLWESTYLDAGMGPVLDAQAVAWIAALGAGIGFDIYQVDDDAG